MALTHTILVTLTNKPKAGYDLWKEFEESVSCYWKATQQQIYRELGKMEKEGWVTSEKIPQEGRPAKKLYSITEAGIVELVNWMQQPSEPTVLREDLLVKVKAGHLVPPEMVLQELKRRLYLHSQKLAAYQEKEQQVFAHPEKLSLQERCLHLTLRRGIGYETQWITWCHEAIEFFEETAKS